MIRGRAQTSNPGVTLAVLVLLTANGALALDPSLDASQYAHTAWKARDGIVRGSVGSIAQAHDGFLWVGTDQGLLRFDGVRTVPFLPGEQIPSDGVNRLLVARDGTLWISTSKSLVSWKDGKLTRYPELTAVSTYPLLQDREGTLWFGTDAPGGLCVARGARVECETDARLERTVFDAYEDSSGRLWIAAHSGIWRWKPGPPEHYPFPPGIFDVRAFAEDDGGALLLATNDGVKRLVNGKLERAPGLDDVKRPLTFLRSRDGSLWIGAFNGLWHQHQGRTDGFGRREGLSGQSVNRIYEDREGTIWVGTSSGLDRFRDHTFPTISTDQGLSSSLTWAVQAGRDGSVWIAASDGLNRWQNGSITFYRKQSGPTGSGGSGNVRTMPLLDSAVRSMALDDRDRLWVGLKDGVDYLEREQAVRVPGIPGGFVLAIAPDGHGNTWVSVADHGLFRWAEGASVENFRWESFGKSAAGAVALLPDPVQHGLWLGFRDGGVVWFKEGRVVSSWGAAEGLPGRKVTHLRFGEQGAVWAATEGGLSRIADGKVRTLTSREGLPCDAVYWSMEDDDHSTWVYMSCGLLRIAPSELDAWVRNPEQKIRATVFETSDGVPKMGTYLGFFGPPVARGPDGKIWFTHDDGVTRIDPRNLPRNELPPPVHVEQVTADGKVYDPVGGRLRLPPRVRDLAIDYTALSLAAPEKVRFRVKLEGQDREWRELVNERRVHYTNLPPKGYRFRVKASNDSGVWNEEGAFLDFTIAPAWYETAWFRALCFAVVAGLLWAVHRIRVRLLERHQGLLVRHQSEITALNDRLMKAQEEERARIAGELHDGIAQQMTTANLLLGTTRRNVPADSQAVLDEVQELLIATGADLRQLSHELHPSVLKEAGLPAALSSYCGEFSKTRCIPVSCEADPGVNELSPGSALALYRIAQEALGNAAKHSKAHQIRVGLARADGNVRLTVSDDGIGFAPRSARHSGGVGLLNMRERIRQLGGTFDLDSEPGRGTTIRAEIPFRPA